MLAAERILAKYPEHPPVMEEKVDLANLLEHSLSPDSTPRRVSSTDSDERWADIAVDNMAVHEIEVRQEQVKMKVAETGALALYSNELGPHELDSVGSRFHESGRCKPCAFFHTKGCQSAAACLFCHRCPAHEKQRRKRLRRQICHSLLSPFDPHGGRTQDGPRPTNLKKAGHSHLHSSDTASTCSGWVSNPDDQFVHSRTTSTSSSQATSMYEGGEVGNVSNLGYVRSPVYQSSRSRMMGSPHNGMQPMMSMCMGPMQSCDEYLGEIGPNEDLHNIPVLEARPGDEPFPGAGNVISSMPPTPAGDLPGFMHKEPPPPPPGMPMVNAMGQAPPQVSAMSMAQVPQRNPPVAAMHMSQQAPPAWPAQGHHSQPQSPSHQSDQMSLSLPIEAMNGCYEQQQQQLQLPQNVPVSPAGYIMCGNTQYALVPVPVQPVDNSPSYAMSSPYQAKNAAVDQHQQQWGQYQASMPYQGEQQWASPYDSMPMGSAHAMVEDSTQWW